MNDKKNNIRKEIRIDMIIMDDSIWCVITIIIGMRTIICLCAWIHTQTPRDSSVHYIA